MNTLKAGLVVFGLVIGTTAMGQDKGDRKTPQERAQIKADWMAKELSLTEDQKAKVTTLHLQSAEKNQAIRKDQSLNEEQKKEAWRNNRKAEKEKLKEILTPEQLATLKARKEEFKGKHREGSKIRGERMHMKSPQERAQMRTERMTKELSLTPEQVAKVKELNLVSAEKEDAIRKDANTTPEQKKEAMKNHFQEQKKMFKEVLTPEQLAILKAKKEEFKKGRACDKPKDGKGKAKKSKK